MKSIKVQTVIVLVFMCLTSNLLAKSNTLNIEHNPPLQIKPTPHNPAFTSFPERSFYSSPEDWQTIIDTTWGPGLPYSEKLDMFNEYADALSESFPLYYRFPVGWEDSVRSHYTALITDTTSRGSFCAILQRFAREHHEAHTYVQDYDVVHTALNPGTPLLVIGGRVTVEHFGAVVTPLPDSTCLVLRVVNDHPLGLVPGDIILGYEGVPWCTQVEELLAAGLPILGSSDGAESTIEREKLMSVGMNWHLFSSIDIVEYATGDTLHLDTAPLINLDVAPMINNEQLAVPGVELPTYFNYDFSQGTWEEYDGEMISYGTIPGTNIGYIYLLAEVSGKVDGLFNEAIQALKDTDGLILDLRYNMGGWALYEDVFDFLFNSTFLPFVDVYRCNSTDYTLCRPDESGEYFWVRGAPNTIYDRPIAVLLGHSCVSMGDITAYWFKCHPMARFFGVSSSASPGDNTSIGPGFFAGPGQWDLHYTISTLMRLPDEELLGAEEVAIDDPVWFMPADAAEGEDTVVKKALEWIQNVVHGHDVAVDRSFAHPGTDTVSITTVVANPNSHFVSTLVHLISTDSTIVDSLYLFDTGNHNDGGDGDGLWGGEWAVPDEEKFFLVSVETADSSEGETRLLPNATRFTTAGPVIFDSLTITRPTNGMPVPGDHVIFKIALKNEGLGTSVTDLTAALSMSDTNATILKGEQSYSAIAPGMTGTSTSYYTLDINENCPTGIDLSMAISVSSERFPFWSDSIKFHVYEPESAVADVIDGLPAKFALRPNSPNPFNPSTSITVALPRSGRLKVVVYNLLGREVAELANSRYQAGYHRFVFDGSDLPSGIYFVRASAPGEVEQARKAVLMK